MPEPTTNAAPVHERPACANECIAVLRREWAIACREQGVEVAEVHITHVAPLVEPLYEDLQMACPHGVVWHMQPTNEQVAQWAEDGVA